MSDHHHHHHHHLTTTFVLLHFYGMVMYLAFFQERFIVHERWPVAGPVDEVLVKSSCYIMEVAHSFRIWLKNLTQPKKSTKRTSNVPAAAKPTHATIWIAKKFPPWQATVLMTMKQLYDVSYALC
jgi:leucyl-tRNA synthetase